jgi:hypothetical protein
MGTAEGVDNEEEVAAGAAESGPLDFTAPEA